MLHRPFPPALVLPRSCARARAPARAPTRVPAVADPDKQTDGADSEAAAATFRQVQRAYAVLSDWRRRQAYNDLITICWQVETGNIDE